VQGGEMNQALYAHMNNKRKKNKIQNKKKMPDIKASVQMVKMGENKKWYKD
jgi:hypothetical protein